MFVTLGGKLLTVAGKFATSLACCCGFDPKKWYCLLSSDGSYRCAQEYDIEQDQMLSEHASKEDCERFCGLDSVYCYYDEAIGYYCTSYIDEGFLSGPYPSTIECNEACKQMYFCVDRGEGGGDTQYECTLQDPVEDYLSGPYGSREACEYRCGSLWWCTYKFNNTDDYEYECVQNNAGAPSNAVSGPFPSQVECNEYCKVCEEIILPDQTPCPECVDDACGFMAGGGGIDGGQWGTCCAGLVETWRYCDGQWTRILPCHPEGERTAGTPACEVYPESLDFPDNPSEGQLYTVACDRVLGFDPSGYPDCEDCNYACNENNGSYDCALNPAGPHKTLQDCVNKCPEKWGCIATDECVQKPDGTYLTESECVDQAPIDCATTGACCFPDYSCQDGSGFNTEGECVDAGGTFYANGVCPDACPEPPLVYGACCYLDDSTEYQCEVTTQQECTDLAGEVWHEGEVCKTDETPDGIDCSYLGQGRCCVYKGEVLGMGCGETRQECEDDARRIAATDPNSFWSADNVEQDTRPEADCPYYVFVYTIIPEAMVPVCWDEDEDGNPVTQEFCDAQSEGLKDTRSVFTAGEDCGEASTGGGTCPAVPPTSSFGTFAPPP